MGNNSFKYIFVIFIILIGLLLIKLYLPNLVFQKSPYLEKTQGLRPQSVQLIEIQKGSETLALKKEENNWKLKGKKADAHVINAFLSSLLPETEPELIAQTDKQYEQFALTNNLSTQIILNRAVTIFTGKYSNTGLYARIDDSPWVYILKDAGSISITPDDWYEKK